jgi:hypothetical protein
VTQGDDKKRVGPDKRDKDAENSGNCDESARNGVLRAAPAPPLLQLHDLTLSHEGLHPGAILASSEGQRRGRSCWLGSLGTCGSNGLEWKLIRCIYIHLARSDGDEALKAKHCIEGRDCTNETWLNEPN